MMMSGHPSPLLVSFLSILALLLFNPTAEAVPGAAPAPYRPCDASPGYRAARAASSPSEVLSIINAARDERRRARDRLRDVVRERERFPILSTTNRKIRWKWATNFSRAVKEASLANLQMRQLKYASSVLPAISTSTTDEDAFRGCHPGRPDGWEMPYEVPEWSRAALTVPDLMTRQMFWKQCCSVRLICDKHKGNRRRRVDQQATSDEDQEQRDVAVMLRYADNPPSPPTSSTSSSSPPSLATVCVSNKPAGCAIDSLRRFFDVLARHRPLGAFGHVRIRSLGSDETLPVVKGRNGVGLPRGFRGPVTGDEDPGNAPPAPSPFPFAPPDAFTAFEAWQDAELAIANDLGPAQQPVREHMALIEHFEKQLGLNFSWHSANLVARHQRCAPLPLGVNDGNFREPGRKRAALQVLREVRQELAGAATTTTTISRTTAAAIRTAAEAVEAEAEAATAIIPTTMKPKHQKRRLLLMNFKGATSFLGSSEREALYHLAGLGRGVSPAASSSPPSPPGIIGGDIGDGIEEEEDSESFGAIASVEPKGQTEWEGGDLGAYYRELASFHFCLSPRGSGLDTFRTWEALAVGTIPIVKRSGPFDAIFDALPVLVVDRWSDVTLALLQRTLDDWRRRPFDGLSVLSWRHWR